MIKEINPLKKINRTNKHHLVYPIDSFLFACLHAINIPLR